MTLTEIGLSIGDYRATAGRVAALCTLNERNDHMAYLLPVELTQKIFGHCLPHIPILLSKSDTDYLARSLANATRTLTRVNRNWRNIAYSTPELWNKLFLQTYPRSFTEVGFATLLANLNLSFQRSRSLPLTICLEMYHHDSQSLPSNLQILEIVCKEAYRWQNIHIAAPMRILSAIADYTSQLVGGVPYLYSFDIESTYRSHLPTPDSWALSIGSPSTPLPSPIYLTTSSGIPLTGKTFDLSRMAYFRPGTLTIPEIVHVLSISPHLTTLICHVSARWFNHLVDRRDAQLPISDHPIHHSFLKTLIVSMYVEHLFARITLPALETLDCSLDKNEYNAFYKFLCRSQCPLKSLSLSLACAGDRIIDLLRLTPNLQDFHFHSALSADFFRYLGGTAELAADEPLFLPQLRTLHFYVPFIFDGEFPLSTLRAALPCQDGNQLIGRRLSQITLELGNDRELTEGEQTELLYLIESGLEIEINRLFESNDPSFLSNYPAIVQALNALKAKNAN